MLLNEEHNLMIEEVIKLFKEHFIALINIIHLIKKYNSKGWKNNLKKELTLKSSQKC